MIRRICRVLFLILTLAALTGCGNKRDGWKGGFGNGFRRNIAIVFFMAAASLLFDDRARIVALVRKS